MTCPDCGDPLTFTFRDTSGVGATKRGDHYNTVPDTDHYLCFPCVKAWKQRLNGPLTPDIVGELAFFTCRQNDCGRPLAPEDPFVAPAEIALTCQSGHRYRIASDAEGNLTLADA